MADGSIQAPSHCPSYLNIDRARFVADFCDNISERPESGVVVMRGALRPDELKLLREATGPNRIPFPMRYMCGQSDDELWTPTECNLSARWLVRHMPHFFEMVAGRLARWLKPDGEQEFLRINGPRDGEKVTVPYGKLQALLGHAMDAVKQGGSSIHIERKFTTMLELPFYSGWHHWHRDRPGSDVDKLWVMLWRANNASTHTGLKVVPHDAIVHYTHPECVQTGLHSGKKLLDEMKCDVEVAPGDAVYYSSHVYHGSQDKKQDREAISLDMIRTPPTNEAMWLSRWKGSPDIANGL